MKNCAFVLLFIIFCWGCSNMEVGVEGDVFSATGMNLPIEDLTVEDILLEGAPEELVRATKKVLGSRMGKILLRELKNRYPNGPFIRFHFFGKIDEDGEIVDEAGEMRYYGMGVIGYNRNALRLKTNEELLFHEFFHVFQTGDLKPQKSRNNELEAYLAQYIYGESKQTTIVNIEFTKMLGVLAKHFRKNSLTAQELDLFYRNYNTALILLEMMPEYSGEGWYTVRVGTGTNPFPNLSKLMKS
ncbi:hypothetical protein [Butyricimonas faecihominis]|jgi:hypothetical protein|uniref:hypothetical protein n=1 Tax=Butyricimonas faecihominis TaxID=1472416 RepID=UPI0032C15E0C